MDKSNEKTTLSPEEIEAKIKNFLFALLTETQKQILYEEAARSINSYLPGANINRIINGEILLHTGAMLSKTKASKNYIVVPGVGKFDLPSNGEHIMIVIDGATILASAEIFFNALQKEITNTSGGVTYEVDKTSLKT